MSNISILSSIIAGSLIFSGCAAPKPSKPNAKPTVFIKSHTDEKYKDMKSEMAIWNGIPPEFLNNKGYMRCDMTPEATVVFVENGFDVVTDKKNADYLLDVTLMSCSIHKAYNGNRMEIPLEQRTLYKDFMKWVNEGNPTKVSQEIKDVAKLIQQNKPEGFKRFYSNKYITKFGEDFDYTEHWGFAESRTINYMAKTKDIILPNKYTGITKEEIAILDSVNTKVQNNGKQTLANATDGTSLIGNGANVLAQGSSQYSGSVGGALIGLGVLSLLDGFSPPTPICEFKVTNNRTGKAWKKDMRFDIDPQSWRTNKYKPMNDWTYDEIPWSELD